MIDTTKGQTAQLLIDAAFEMLKEIFRPNMSLDDVAEEYSPRVDEIIIKYEKEGVKFIAGKFKISAADRNSFTLNFELYFRDKDGKWSRVVKTSSAMSAKDWLSPEARKELLSVKEKIFDVEAPQTDSNAAAKDNFQAKGE